MSHKIAGKFERILFISDLHAPYMHPDTIPFLKALKEKIKPDFVALTGDEVDFQALSYHESNPDLPSAGDELEMAIDQLTGVYKLFPEAAIVDSNHGSLVYRKAFTAGIPKHAVKGYREILKAPKNWKWYPDLCMQMVDGKWVYLHHSKGANSLKTSQAMGMSFVQGHHHEKFSLEYWGNPHGLYWAMTIGCLIDDKALAFNYNKVNLKRPVIGTGAAINGQGKLFPMVLDNKGRWVGKL